MDTPATDSPGAMRNRSVSPPLVSMSRRPAALGEVATNHALLGAISNARLPAPSVWGVATKPARAPRPGFAAAALAATPEACAGAGSAEGLVANSQANI